MAVGEGQQGSTGLPEHCYESGCSSAHGTSYSQDPGDKCNEMISCNLACPGAHPQLRLVLEVFSLSGCDAGSLRDQEVAFVSGSVELVTLTSLIQSKAAHTMYLMQKPFVPSCCLPFLYPLLLQKPVEPAFPQSLSPFLRNCSAPDQPLLAFSLEAILSDVCSCTNSCTSLFFCFLLLSSAGFLILFTNMSLWSGQFVSNASAVPVAVE